MGIVAQVFALTEDRLQLILKHPPLLGRLTAPDDPEAVQFIQEELAKSKGSGLFGFLRKKEVAPIPDVEFSAEELSDAYLDKAWHAIHYLFTGDTEIGSPPLNFLHVGGQDVPGSDNGLGPSRVFDAAQTRAIADALSGLSMDTLMARYDGEKMDKAGVYPEIWGRDNDSREYCEENLHTLREFILKAARDGKGLIVCMS